MIRLAVLCILLTACATQRAPDNYGQLDPCAVIAGKVVCKTGATEAEKQAWADYHIAPSLDECERRSLRRHMWAASADSVSTIAALGLCATLREVNPIIAAVPGGWLILPLSFAAYQYDKSVKGKTSRYVEDRRPGQCGLDSTDVVVGFRGAVALHNGYLLARCL